ncbi:MAG TPA: choice-of-anchor L domain-containing protein [Euzebya sp.]|nr:choice-of-anchor L domain-containing protein [Euzebya sp.]
MNTPTVRTIILIAALMLTALPAAAQPTGLQTQDLDSGLTPSVLASGLVGDGVTVSGVSYTGSDISAGGFSGGEAAGVGFDSGIVLSTGQLGDLAGPNGSGSTGEFIGGPGDADLDALASSDGVERDTNDATVLEFDFVPDGAEVRFDYVFGSEEYNEFVGTGFNDVFGFFVNGSNCAVVDGDPVTINTINNEANAEQFRDNTDGSLDIELDGLTTTLQCVAAVNPGVANRLKLAIADTGDSVYDAAVFLRAGSLSTGSEIPVGDPGVARIDGGTGDPRDVAIEACRVAVPFGQRADRVVVARDDVFADALAGAALLNAQTCILYTPGGPDEPLDPVTRAEIDRLLPPVEGQPRLVDIVGGTAAVSASVEQELTAAGYAVRRLAGGGRHETARIIATTAYPEADEAILAFAGDWPDAITAGAFAATAGRPVLLTDTAALHPEAAAGLTAMGVQQTTIVGGTAVVGPAVEAAVPDPRRISGDNRMATAAAIATEPWADVADAGDAYIVVNLERPDAWQLALAAAPVSAQFLAPQLGVGADRYPAETEAFLQSRGFDELPAIVLIGDLAFISDTVAQMIGGDVGA